MIFKNPVSKKHNNVTVKNFGGIVTALHPSFIGNDRLSDGFNIWNKNGNISSRPGICSTFSPTVSKDVNCDNIKLYYSNFPYEKLEGYNKFCALVKNSGESNPQIDFFAVDTEGDVHNITQLDLSGKNGQIVHIKNLVFIKSTKISGGGIFVIVPVHTINPQDLSESKEVLYFEFSSDYKNLIKILPENLYRPTIIKNGFGNFVTADVRREYKESRPEGVNLLNGLFEARFIIDGVSNTFCVPTVIAEDAPIEIRYQTSEYTYESVTINGGDFKSDSFTHLGQEVYVTVSRETGKIFIRSDGAPYALSKLIDGETLRIFSYADVKGADYEIFSSGVSPILFDSRLFMAGGESRNNKVYYSSKTEHLYFCEDYSVSVGNKSYNLTALSMQSKYIIAFKEKEIYRLSITCTDEISKEKIEIDGNGLVFETPKCTVTQINDSLGCDLPDTIVTCANRLVWFHSDGAVYTLYGSNLYTEGSIYELSSNISNLLINIPKNQLKNAFAADFNGYYVLGLYNRLFLMDVRVNGFRYLSSQKNNKNGLSWFLWTAPKNTGFMSGFVIGGKEYFILSSDSGRMLFTAQLSGEKDIVETLDKEEVSIPEFSLSTAIFDENFADVDRISFNALIKHPAEFCIFDEDKEENRQSVNSGKEFKSYISPVSYKKGGIGIKIKGSGEFKLKDIIFCFKERLY